VARGALLPDFDEEYLAQSAPFRRSPLSQLASRYQVFALALVNIDGQKNITINATQTVGTAANGSQVENVVIRALNVATSPLASLSTG